MHFSHRFSQRAFQYIKDHDLIHEGDHILVGVSGGPDSTALLECLLELRPFLLIKSLTVLHFDHELRGRESTRDRVFVLGIASEKSLSCWTASEDVKAFAVRKGLSLEMAARSCRHRFFSQAMKALRGDGLALGHHADDQAEELLLRICRGTGPSGMAGMLPRSKQGIIRPLLFARREEILEFLTDLHLSYVVDSSNEKLFCQRNIVRHKVVPLLEQHIHPGVTDTIGRHARLARDEEEYWQECLEAWCEQFTTNPGPSAVVVTLKDLSARHVAFRRRFYRHVVRALIGSCSGIFMNHVEALDRMVKRGRFGRYMKLPGGIMASIGRECLVLTLEHAPPPVSFNDCEEISLFIYGPGVYEAQDFGLVFHVRKESMKAGDEAVVDASANVARMAMDDVLWPLLVRRWRKGDRFKPLGMAGTKKLQDFFVDAKIPRDRRHQVAIVCDREKICWIVGQRLDSRVRVKPSSGEIIVIEAFHG